MQAVLNQLQALGPKPIPTLTPAEARRQPTPADAAKAQLRQEGKPTTPDPAVASSDRTIPGAAGALPARVYTPKDARGPFPVIVYYHGGGWVIADKNVYDAGARALSKMANAVVVSVDYRQGPEHRFPAAHDDAYAAYRWALQNAASIGGDPKRVALAGESAGGGLAVATAMMARDNGVQAPIAVISVYPIAGTDTTTPSYFENANAKPLNRSMMSWFFNNYLRGPQDRQDPRVNLVAADLKGLPPTTIINAQIDPLRSEGEMLADRLRAAGVDVEQKTYEAVTHEFFGMGMVVNEAMDAQKMAAEAIKKRAAQ
jgi:acetyl esterase/lipase